MMKVVVDDKIPYIKGVLEPYASVVYKAGSAISREDLMDADALIVRTRTKCNQSLLEGTSVKFIATATIGFDHIDTAWCESAGIHWTNAPGCNSSSVQQYIASALLFLAVKYQFSLEDKTLGVVGVGNVGSKVASLAKAFGMNVLLNDPPRARKEGEAAFVSFDKIVKEADIITFHVPLNKSGQDKTLYLADESFFKKISLDAIIINSSRGQVVNNDALKNALKDERLTAAVLDVWENEPAIDLGLLERVDLATPHIAGYSKDGKANGTAMSIQALSRFFSLGIDSWYPESIEKPENNLLEIDCKGYTKEQVLMAVIGNTYDISYDDELLRKQPENFEKQRGDYYVRREFPAFTVKLINDNDKIADILASIGFNVQ